MVSKDAKHLLHENCREVATALRSSVAGFDYWKCSTEPKDSMRLEDIFAKDPSKWIRACENMAAKITTTEKAVRRAKAAIEVAPANVDVDTLNKMVKAFLFRSVELHVGVIDPRDLVMLRKHGALK